MKTKNTKPSKKSISDATTECAKSALQKWHKNYKKKYGEKGKAHTSNHFDIFFPSERRIHSIMQSGLTSFGQGFWEPLANKIAELNGYEVIQSKLFNTDVPEIPSDLKDFQQRLRVQIESGSMTIKDAVKKIQENITSKKLSSTKRTKVESGKGIDFWFKKNNIELIGDIKSPQENMGNGKKLAEHILIWSTYRLLDDSSANIEAVIALPYNPFKNLKEYEKEQGSKLDLLEHGSDILLADQFWDKLSGHKNSTKIIFNALRKLSDSDEIKRIKKLFPTK